MPDAPTTEPAPPSTGSICLVAHDLAYVVRNGGIGTYFWLTAHLLARGGWKVHILYCGPPERPEALAGMAERLAVDGIGFTDIHEVHPDPSTSVRQFGTGNWALDMSQRVMLVLQRLQRSHGFDLIEFADWKAIGFRSIQAKRRGLAFADVHLLVKLHATSRWERHGNAAWFNELDDLKIDHCERYAFERCDTQLSPSRYMARWADDDGMDVRDDLLVAYPHPPTEFGAAAAGPIEEVVFFGRLEVRKGLDVFLAAVADLDPAVRITFLGRDTVLGNGVVASDWIRSALPGRDVVLRTDADREEAISYLVEAPRLAVVASRSETFGFTAAECIAHEIPFVAFRAGGLPEIFDDAAAAEAWLCDADPASLSAAIEGALAADPVRAATARRRVRASCAPEARDPAVLAAYAEALERKRLDRGGAARPARSRPLVTVAVTHHDLGDELVVALRSLAEQSYEKLEVLVIDDGSTDEASLERFHELARTHDGFAFTTQANAGPGAARNRLLEQARGELFVPFDADNIALPHMVERFADSMAQPDEPDVLTCFFLAFDDVDDLATERYAYQYVPTGGPTSLAAVENVFGDTNAAFRTEALLGVGGFCHERRTPWEDWETFVRLVRRGARLDVVPEVLMYYRLRAESRTNVLAAGPFGTFPLEQHLLEVGFVDEAVSIEEAKALWALTIAYRRLEERRHLEVTRMSAELELAAIEVKRLGDGLLETTRRAGDLEAALLEIASHEKPFGYRFADDVDVVLRRHPTMKRTVKRGLRLPDQVLRWLDL